MVEIDFIREMLNGFFSDEKHEFVVTSKHGSPVPETSQDTEFCNVGDGHGNNLKTGFTTGECDSNLM